MECIYGCIQRNNIEYGNRAYQGFPAEDVAVEADPVLREVEATLQEDISLQCTGVVWWKLKVKTKPFRVNHGHSVWNRNF